MIVVLKKVGFVLLLMLLFQVLILPVVEHPAIRLTIGVALGWHSDDIGRWLKLWS